LKLESLGLTTQDGCEVVEDTLTALIVSVRLVE
jgi:hypothetical protein